MNILAIIPARIGSKGLPKKNLLKVGNFSLVERALLTALNSSLITDIIVSSDSSEVIDVVNKYGNFAPFIRPDKLSTDEAGSIGFMIHGLQWAQAAFNRKYQYIVLLEPPCPFRLPEHVNTGIRLAIKNSASSVVSLVEVGDYHPVRMKKINSNGEIKGILSTEPDGLRRQDQEPVYIRNSAVYVFSAAKIKENILWGKKTYGFIMDKDLYKINIDEEIDYLSAISFHEKMQKENKLSLIENLNFK